MEKRGSITYILDIFKLYRLYTFFFGISSMYELKIKLETMSAQQTFPRQTARKAAPPLAVCDDSVLSPLVTSNFLHLLFLPVKGLLF